MGASPGAVLPALTIQHAGSQEYVEFEIPPGMFETLNGIIWGGDWGGMRLRVMRQPGESYEDFQVRVYQTRLKVISQGLQGISSDVDIGRQLAEEAVYELPGGAILETVVGVLDAREQWN